MSDRRKYPPSPLNQGLNQGLRPEESGEENLGEPEIPLVDDRAGDIILPRAASGQQPRAQKLDRDDSDRESGERELQERDLSDEERLEMFRLSMFQEILPAVPQFPNYHLCWLTTNNPRDSIQGRIRQGYQLVQAAELPGQWETNTVNTGQYAGCVCINEMILAKLPMRLYEMYMIEAHHNQPLAEEGKLRATLDAIKDQAAGQRGSLIEEEGTAQLGTRTRRPNFEGVR